MGTDIKLEINDKEISDYLFKYSARAKNLKTLMRRVGKIIANDIDDNFESEGTNQGDKWTEWSLDWKQSRTKKGRGDGKILQFNGELRESMTRLATNDSVIVGTNKEYAAIHNFGGDIKKRNGKGTFKMPERRFMAFTEELRAKILQEIIYQLTLLDYKGYTT